MVLVEQLGGQLAQKNVKNHNLLKYLAFYFGWEVLFELGLIKKECAELANRKLQRKKKIRIF